MIQLKNVTKKFGSFTAVDGISFTVENSSIYGLIGYNGAGKTTLLKTVAGIYNPEGGKALLDGENSFDNPECRERLFYIPDDMYFLPNITLEGMAKFYQGMYKSFDMNLFSKIVKIFSLDPKAKIRSFSKGMKRQSEIAFALSSRPKYMLLDEVFDGLDPQKKEICRNLFLEYMAESECSVIISSHSLADLGNLCDRIGLINGKKLSVDCSIDDIPRFNKKYRVSFNEKISTEKLSGLPLTSLKIQGNTASFDVSGKENIEKINVALSLMSVSDINEIPMTLEEVFLKEMEGEGYDLQQLFS